MGVALELGLTVIGPVVIGPIVGGAMAAGLADGAEAVAVVVVPGVA